MDGKLDGVFGPFEIAQENVVASEAIPAIRGVVDESTQGLKASALRLSTVSSTAFDTSIDVADYRFTTYKMTRLDLTSGRMAETILLITVDSLRVDRVGATTPSHRPDRRLTPTIDALAAEGLCCTNAFSTGPGTRQSFPGILSSTPPLAFGGYNRFSERRPALAERLRDVGYRTCAIHSNAQLSSEFGYDRGFDDFIDGKGTSEGIEADDEGRKSAPDESPMQSLRAAVGQRVFERPLVYRLLKRLEARLDGVTRPYTSATDTRKLALDWLRNRDGKAFLWVHFMDVHVPYYPPRRFRQEVGIDEIGDSKMVDLWLKLNTAPDSLTGADIGVLEKLYDATVRYVDYEVGMLLDGLASMGRRDPVVAFTSDHGDEFRDHGGLTHSPQLYDELIHVPLVLQLNGEPATIENPVSLLDVAPTLVEHFAGSTDGFWGRSIRPSTSDDRAVFSEVSQSPNDARDEIDVDARITSCRTDRWTYVRDDLRGREELYDRQSDPTEHRRVEDEHGAVRDRMADRIAEFRARVDETSPELIDRDMSASVETRLRDLGYLGGGR